MSEVIQKGNYFYKKVEILMLETEKASNLRLDNYGKLDFSYLSGNLKNKKQHIYLLSDDKIKEGDWCIGDGIVYEYKDINSFSEKLKLRSKKIIATTNYSLKLSIYDSLSEYPKSLPPLTKEFLIDFIFQYNSGNAIIETLVEVYVTHETSGDKFLNYKTNHNNEIIINLKIEEKIYTHSEIENILSRYTLDFQKHNIDKEKSTLKFKEDWIKNNL